MSLLYAKAAHFLRTHIHSAAAASTPDFGAVNSAWSRSTSSAASQIAGLPKPPGLKRVTRAFLARATASPSASRSVRIGQGPSPGRNPPISDVGQFESFRFSHCRATHRRKRGGSGVPQVLMRARQPRGASADDGSASGTAGRAQRAIAPSRDIAILNAANRTPRRRRSLPRRLSTSARLLQVVTASAPAPKSERERPARCGPQVGVLKMPRSAACPVFIAPSKRWTSRERDHI